MTRAEAEAFIKELKKKGDGYTEERLKELHEQHIKYYSPEELKELYKEYEKIKEKRGYRTFDIYLDRRERFVYTARDVAGCTLETPSYKVCEDCIYSYKDNKKTCMKYQDYKPDSVILDKGCPNKLTK